MNSIGISLTSVQASSCLKELKLANCSLSYLPDEIGNLISLQSLDLQQNNLITLPDRICNLTCLERLNLGCNNVSHLPSEIGRLTSLGYLNLGFFAEFKDPFIKRFMLQCKRSLTLPDSFWSLTRLERLFFDGCDLSH
ncbi:leucine-rich repeat domain-containing protein, partial [Salmonella enterica subsp. enterica serovar Paratyphi A]